MSTDGWIVEIERKDDDAMRRRYYRLSPWGRKIAQAEAARLAHLVEVARSRRLLPVLA
jgi:DNA-binding PadR family transcriptional regulator